MLKAKELGSSLYNKFVQERLVDNGKGFFDSIPRTKLNTGIEKKKKMPKAIEVLKEDRQAFGLIVSKSVSMEEAFLYPITTVPLLLATTEFGLRQSDKASFRNHLIEESKCITEAPPKGCTQFADGRAAVRTLKPRTTYKDYIDALLRFVTPKKDYIDALLRFVTPKKDIEPHIIGIINDTYSKDSVKERTRQNGGELI